MPEIKATVAVEGLTPDPTANTKFRWGTVVRYRDNKRNDETSVIEKDVQGPDWKPDFKGQVVGGTMQFVVDATLEGQLVDAELTEAANVKIRGTNPAKAAIKGRLGPVENQVISFKESRFRQFRDNGDPLFGPPNGFGVMQIDTPPATKTEI
jgi:hypothetical protein